MKDYKKMTKEELESEYYGRRPTEPYSEDDSPNDWANIVQYAEETLDKAFKAIAELEAQIEQNKIDLAIAEHDREHDDYEFTEVYTKVEQLKKENAELKEKLNFSTQYYQGEKAKEQLTKAKEIIKKFSKFINNEVEFDSEHPQEHTDLWNELCEKAEQFLNSEVVKK